MKRESTIWLNCEGGHVYQASVRDREEADKMACEMDESYGRKRTACIELNVSWVDGDGLEGGAV